MDFRALVLKLQHPQNVCDTQTDRHQSKTSQTALRTS